MGDESTVTSVARAPHPARATVPGGRSEPRRVPSGGRSVPVDESRFRHVLGHFASGVTVITAPQGEGAAGPAGFTCQSFAALSLEPPMVTFLVARTSTTWPRIADAGVFCVNILTSDQGELCRGFARRGVDKFAGVEWDPGRATGSPMLRGALAWIDCTIDAVHPGGDHHIVTGRVHHLAAAPHGTPLLFYCGSFGSFSA
ncbi:flavin reductase family protein [Streptomyces sp. CA-250714]|uniref:flavin reductase family protein n=1 Tax=Streptomyces sp. CA-250714 TaxID=3240060 RepID=UPI003D90746C